MVFDEQRNDDSNILLEGLQKVNKEVESKINKVLSKKQHLKNEKETADNEADSFVDNVLTKRVLDATIKNVKNDIDSNEKRINFCFLDIQGDIRRKLSEYYYLEEKLYPDFPTYISYQKNKFIRTNNSQNGKIV